MPAPKDPEEQQTRIVSTKVDSRQFERLSEFSKRHGYNSLYELVKAILCVMLKYDNQWYDASQGNKEQIAAFMAPFLEIKDPSSYIAGCEKDFGINLKRKKEGDIEYVVVRQGGFISHFMKKDGKLMISHNADKAAQSIALAGRPGLQQIISDTMKAYKTSSFLELLKMLLIDVSEDVNTMQHNNMLGYSAIEYGNVPKKTHDETSENINPFIGRNGKKR